MQKLYDHPVLGRGFRPFFILGALYSVISIGIWGTNYAGYGMSPDIFMASPIAWHAHEMLYGFAMAIVAGFLLTAVANWTGGAPVRQGHLLGLCALWLVGRIVMNVDLGFLPDFVQILEVAFVPALTISLAVPLLRRWNKRNFIFISFLTVLFVCDAWFLISETMEPAYLALMMILMMISLIGGRIIPAFTVAALRRRGMDVSQTAQKKMDAAALISLVAVAVCLVIAQDGLCLSVAAALSAAIHAYRMRFYHSLKTLGDPMLWILHLGYLWLVAGMFLISLAGAGVLALSIALHALTVGCIGSMTIGMMCRVSLGHTGRELVASDATTFAFVLMQITVLVRLLGPTFLPEYASLWIVASAVMWSMCYGTFLIAYTPILVTARPDGQEV